VSQAEAVAEVSEVRGKQWRQLLHNRDKSLNQLQHRLRMCPVCNTLYSILRYRNGHVVIDTPFRIDAGMIIV